MSEEVSLWWRQAVEDLDSAKANITSGKYYVASLLAQQAAEKALKALTIKKLGELFKTHDLVFLAEKLGLPQNLLDLCDSLSKVYLTSRYPDASGEIPADSFTKADAISDVSNAEEVLEWVKKRM